MYGSIYLLHTSISSSSDQSDGSEWANCSFLETRAFWKKYLIPRSGQEIWKMNLSALIIPVSEEAVRNHRGHVGHQKQIHGKQIWCSTVFLFPPDLAIIVKNLKIRLLSLSDFLPLILLSTSFISIRSLIWGAPVIFQGLSISKGFNPATSSLSRSPAPGFRGDLTCCHDKINPPGSKINRYG